MANDSNFALEAGSTRQASVIQVRYYAGDDAGIVVDLNVLGSGEGTWLRLQSHLTFQLPPDQARSLGEALLDAAAAAEEDKQPESS